MLQKNHIKYLQKFKGESLREISKETKHDFRTVQKYADKVDWNEVLPVKRKERRSNLDPVKPIIDSWLQEDMTSPRKQRHTARRVYDRLKKEQKEIFKSSLRTVELYVAKRKQELFNPKEEGYIPLEHPAGEAQADFGKALFYENGKKIEGHYLTLSFPYSNGSYCQMFRGENQECLLDAMKQIFEYIGRVPYKIWFDNLSAAVVEIGKNKKRKLVAQFEKFSLHYGFGHNFCNPGKGHEKGNVENKVGYERRNFFVPIPHINNLVEYNKALLQECDRDMNRSHYKKDTKIKDLFEKEKKTMFKLPEKEFEVCRLEKAVANKYGKVIYDKNTYSASPDVAQKEVWLKITADKVIILNEKYELITPHSRLYGSKKESMNWYPYLSLVIKRPNALKYTEFYNELPQVWKEYFNQCSYEGRKTGLKVLVQMIKENSIDIASKALKDTLDSGVSDADSILTTYYRITNNTPDTENMPFLDMPCMIAYVPDLAVYDTLLQGGVQQ